MFFAVRLILCIVCFAFSAFAVHKSKLMHKRLGYILSGALIVILMTMLSLWPFENFFFTFDSAEGAYSYHQNISNIVAVLDGDNSTFVMGITNENTHNIEIVPKTNDGWKISNGFDTKLAESCVSDNYSISVYQYRNTDDYFVMLRVFSDSEMAITDFYDSEFIPIEQMTNADNVQVTYLAHLQQIDEHYWISIGNEKIFIVNDSYI